MGKSARTSAHGGTSIWRLLGAVLLTAGWFFAAASLVSFDVGDAPTHLVYPPNSPTHNLCGPAGAWVAYHSFRMLGWGAWVVAAGVGFGVAGWLFGGRVGMASLRLVGVLMIGCAAAALQALLFPSTGPIVNLPGGLVGSAGCAELVERFGALGSAVWLLLLAVVGAIVAFDRFVLATPAWLANVGVPAARTAGSVVGASAYTAARAGSTLVVGLSGVRSAQPVRVRLNDIGDEVDVTPRPSRRRRATGDDEPAVRDPRVRVIAVPPAEAPAQAARTTAESMATDNEGPDHRRRDGGTDAEAIDDDLPGAPQVFDPEALRAKIARLPIVFGHETRKVATDADLRDLQGVADLPGYQFPNLDMLEAPEENFSERLEEYVREQAQALESALKQYRIDGEVVGIESGPVITLYEVRLAPGTKVAQITAVDSDLARALKAINIRIVPNMQGRDTIGIEVPNSTKEKVRLKELMSKSESFGKMKLPLFLGKDASGEPLIADLAQMPHLLIAGTTGSGKSVCMNTIIMGFLYTKKPSELKLVLVDPKMVEMSQFKDIPHLMCPVVTEMGKAAAILEWATTKMDERYELLSEAGCRDIAAYNDLPWEELRERFNPQSPEEEARIPRKLPYMVFVIDELADLMMTAKEVEGSIIRIAQKARAVGIHLILATQRPQANVVTGLIKSNMPARICFKVSSGMDSRIVLDQKGGELLLGQGDMLYLSPRSHKLTRAQATLVDDLEIRKVVRHMRDVAKPSFERQLLQLRTGNPDEDRLLESENNSSASLSAAQEDPMFDRAVEVVLETKRGSVSLLQRRLAIGYTRASRLIDLMGIAGILGEHKGSLARDVMISAEEWAAMKRQAELDRVAGEKVDTTEAAAPAAGDGPPALSTLPTAEEPEDSAAVADEEAPFDDDEPVDEDGAESPG
ncbi:MAG: DNA translocase FtsK [Phycisphaerales bacterium]|nr:DNA translocase FtsK [Phycisphaerales bacterium]